MRKIGIAVLSLWVSLQQARGNVLCFASELGGDEYGGVDGTSGVAGDEGFHREPSRHGRRCYAAVVLSFRRRECPQGNCFLIYLQPSPRFLEV